MRHTLVGILFQNAPKIMSIFMRDKICVKTPTLSTCPVAVTLVKIVEYLESYQEVVETKNGAQQSLKECSCHFLLLPPGGRDHYC